MKGTEVLDVDFDANWKTRGTPRNTIHICRSLDYPESLLIQMDYDGREDDFIYMTVDIMDLMLALGKIFKNKTIL